MIKAKRAFFSALLLTGLLGYMPTLSAETLQGALAKAYVNNTTLNSSRAGVRVSDEDIAIAKAGYRPTIEAVGSYGRGNSTSSLFYSTVGSVGIQLSQSLFDGFQTLNNVANAEATARAQREALRNEEQNQLNNAVGAYANLFAARRIAALRRDNLAALDEQVRADRAKLEVGQGTRTDLAQSEASRALAQSELSQAIATVKSAEATYKQVVGALPGTLETPNLANDLPPNLDLAYQIANEQHPAILSAKYSLDASSYNVKSKEGALLPQINLSASSAHQDVFDGISGINGQVNSVGVQLTIPIYQGGGASASVRRSKEQLGQARIQVDLYRQNVYQALESAWANLEGTTAAVRAYRESVRAAKIALSGRQQEYQVGEATTLDVLDSRSQLITAQVSLENAQSELVIVSYNLKSAIGQMTADRLGLQVAKYNPKEHYNAVKDKWIGLKTPDGR